MSRCVSCIHFQKDNCCNYLGGRITEWDAEHCQHFYCDRCGTKFLTWMGQSVVECPKCGKVML